MTNILTAHTLEVASSLDSLLLTSFRQDTYPDREFHSPLRRTLQHMLLTLSGLAGQDMRHLADSVSYSVLKNAERRLL